jgi:methionyl-tRNA formyltransferase
MLRAMRIVFMGSPEFALPALRRLIESEHQVVAVFTQPDRRSGRGRRTAPPPVKPLAIAHGIPVFQPKSISKAESLEQLGALAPDVGVIAAYGQILKQPVLDVPRLGILNVHASLLPRWRGAAPVPAAILAGDPATGATIMRVVLALDAGPVLDAVRVPIAPDDTTGTLTAKVAEAGAALLMDVLPRYGRGDVTPAEQDGALATYAPQIRKTDALIAWERDDAATIARQVRAYNPWPMAYSYLDGQPFRIVEATALTGPAMRGPGTIMLAEGGSLAVSTHGGALAVRVVQPPGGRAMTAAAYLNGHRDVVGKRLTSDPASTTLL